MLDGSASMYWAVCNWYGRARAMRLSPLESRGGIHWVVLFDAPNRRAAQRAAGRINRLKISMA